ncbi:MAG: radical SAM protein [Chloroflexi bacterium]|nr:radical SAM protein [Chloroflexota bacterium]
MKMSMDSPVILFDHLKARAEQDCACADEIAIPKVWYLSSSLSLETDCACAQDGMLVSGEVLVKDDFAWQHTTGLYWADLPQKHTLVLSPQASAGAVVLNPAARRVLEAFTGCCTVSQVVAAMPELEPREVELAVWQMTRLGLLQQQGHSSPPPQAAAGTLTAWLHITNACNLRCIYCYVQKTQEEMDEATGHAAIEAIFRSAMRHGFLTVKIKYAGGEPTLNFPLIRILHEQACKLAQSTGLKLQEVVLSNGVALTDEMLVFMQQEGMRLSISLDGIGLAHDKQRAFANGHSSFEHVVRNIALALACGLLPHLSITVTRQNVADVARVVEFALGRDLLFNLNFYRGEERAGDADLIAAIREAFAVIEAKLPRYSLATSLLDRAGFAQPHSWACGAGHSYLVIDQHGRVGCCQMDMDHPVGHVWMDDPLLAVQSAETGFRNVPADARENCADCSWRYWCAGGCPLLTHWLTGRSDIGSPYCDVYRALYPDLLRLEGLRIMHWHSSGGAGQA